MKRLKHGGIMKNSHQKIETWWNHEKLQSKD
jgi:hypothetical protein